MSKAMKKDKFKKYEGEKELDLNSSSKDDELLLRLLASLRAKPFAILAGHSGTGKSRYVKKLAYMTCNVEELRNENQLPGNYLLLQVKPNWHDSTDLLGFRNAMVRGAYQKTELIKFLFKAYHFAETPFFLCLDEMNLAPVEQYFAEFLSAMESKEPVPLNDISEKDDNLLELGCEWEDSLEYLKNNGFSIPNNLFIVGTVNMDETTNQFSRKVLDRAFTIEMTDVDFTNYGKVAEPSYDDTLKPDVIEELLNGENAVSALDEEDKKADSSLVKVQKALASTPFAIAYRFANEYTLLKRAIKCFDVGDEMKLDALDQAVLMKILPRIAGERDYIEKVYGEKENEGLRGALEGKQVSLSKISEILKRAKDINSLHITFWP
jgi:5-methylcytosine-specific restriction endonuclease McrBC GTP-binding regulatory subunit McrB